MAFVTSTPIEEAESAPLRIRRTQSRDPRKPSAKVSFDMAATTAPLSAGEIVRAKVALRGVPSGTLGKVIHVQGLSWIRYWVWFDNGERVGTIDRANLMTIPEFERRMAGGDETPSAASGGATAAGAGAAPAGEVAESVNGVPALLIERSRLARERWAAKKG